MSKPLRYIKITGIIIFIYIVSSLDYRTVINTLQQINLWFVILYFITLISYYMLRVLRWHLIQKHFTTNLGYLNNLVINIESLYLGFITPGRVGDVIKVLLMKEYFNVPKKDGLVVYLYDRYQDLIFLSVVSILGMMLVIEYKMSAMIYMVLLVIFMIYIFKKNIYELVSSKFGISYKINFDARLDARLFLLNVVIFFLYYLQTYLLALSLGISIEFIYLVSVAAIATVLTMIPITVAGLGVREGVFIYFMSSVGVAKESAVILSLLDNIVFLAIFIFVFHMINIFILKRKMNIKESADSLV